MTPYDIFVEEMQKTRDGLNCARDNLIQAGKVASAVEHLVLCPLLHAVVEAERQATLLLSALIPEGPSQNEGRRAQASSE